MCKTRRKGDLAPVHVNIRLKIRVGFVNFKNSD